MTKRIDIVCFNYHENKFEWPCGEIINTDYSNSSIQDEILKIKQNKKIAACLFWDARLGTPDSGKICSLLDKHAHLFHAGLKIGTPGLPKITDYVFPVRMLNLDPPADIEASSWRMSLRACLIKREVFEKKSGIDINFKSVEAAALEMGHRYLAEGVIMRSVASFGLDDIKRCVLKIPFTDEIRFAVMRYGKRWAYYSFMRAVFSRKSSLAEMSAGFKQLLKPRPILKSERMEEQENHNPEARADNVGVIIPTLDRYKSLYKVLEGLRNQTVKASEVIIIDQTSAEKRDADISKDFKDLPLKIIVRDVKGQSSARNAGIKASKSQLLLFLDDDVEIPKDLIEKHLNNIQKHDSDVSSGTVRGSNESTQETNKITVKISDILPGGNSMIKRRVFDITGGFDLAYDRKAGADGDLGTRIYLSGGLNVQDSSICILHHHAASGGLREHRARTITYAMSRNKLLYRRFPSPSEIYQKMRFYSGLQIREMLVLSALGTFSIKSGPVRKILKVLIALALFPSTIYRLAANHREAKRMLKEYPKIEYF